MHLKDVAKIYDDQRNEDVAAIERAWRFQEREAQRAVQAFAAEEREQSQLPEPEVTDET